MKKSTFVAVIMGIIGGIIAACGMVLAMVEQFNLFVPGIIIGCVGILILALIYPVYCAIAHKSIGKPNGKIVGVTIYGVISALTLGVGMCLAMVFDKMALGIVIGAIGLLMCLILIPMVFVLTGHPLRLTAGKIVSIVVGTIGFALVCAGTGICLPNIGSSLMIVGLILGLVGVLVCALVPVIYQYKKINKFN